MERISVPPSLEQGSSNEIPRTSVPVPNQGKIESSEDPRVHIRYPIYLMHFYNIKSCVRSLYINESCHWFDY